MSVALAPHAGRLLGGRYRLGARLGAGGMATIYRAHDERLDRAVAVKIIHAHLADDPDLVARFRIEARHAASLSHPHIVNIFDQGAADLPYIVMELVDGPSLRAVLRANGRLEPGQALAIVEPLCAALDHAHAAGVVHRDIKPENVLVDREGRPKVADFGIARLTAATSHTRTGIIVGSVHYVAPELVDGHEATPASDQYALGVVLYELLTGVRPLQGESPMAIALRHAREPLPAPSAVVASCPEAVDAVVARAAARDAGERFETLAQLAEALRAAVPGGPSKVVVPAPHDDVPGAAPLVIPAEQPTMRQARLRRRAGRLTLAGVIILLGVLLGTLMAWNYVVAPITPVPRLEGLDQAEALAQARGAGFALKVDDRRFSLRTPAGGVLAQRPQAATARRKGSELSVTVSRGPRQIQPADVSGQPVRGARRALELQRFDVAVRRRFSDRVPAGRVISQRPGPAAAVDEASTVALVVSRGVEQAGVPDLMGREQEQAERLLAERGLSGVFAGGYSDEQPTPGTVVSQAPAPGTRVDKGAEVEATVSLGALTIAVPDVRGHSVEQAQADLESAGLAVNVEGQARPTFGPFKQGQLFVVEQQLPQAGEAIQRGETATLYTFNQ